MDIFAIISTSDVHRTIILLAMANNCLRICASVGQAISCHITVTPLYRYNAAPGVVVHYRAPVAVLPARDRQTGHRTLYIDTGVVVYGTRSTVRRSARECHRHCKPIHVRLHQFHARVTRSKSFSGAVGNGGHRWPTGIEHRGNHAGSGLRLTCLCTRQPCHRLGPHPRDRSCQADCPHRGRQPALG